MKRIEHTQAAPLFWASYINRLLQQLIRSLFLMIELNIQQAVELIRILQSRRRIHLNRNPCIYIDKTRGKVPRPKSATQNHMCKILNDV